MDEPSLRLKVLSFALFQGLLFGLVGLLFGVLYSFGGLIYDLMTIGLNRGTALAFLALLGMPAIFVATGMLAGLMQAILFNYFNRWFRFDLKRLFQWP